MDYQDRTVERAIVPGERVYDGDGRLLGRVSALSGDRFETELIDAGGVDTGALPGQAFGEGYLMWRCDECGEMGDIDDGTPDRCPACGAQREAIGYVRED